MIIVSSLWLIFLIIVYIILDKLFKKHLAKKSESYNHVMLIEKGFLQFGRIGGLLCAVASICGFVFDQIVIATAMLIFSVIFQFFVCLYYSFSLFYNDKELVYRDFIRYKLMRFDEIISISFDGENLKLSTKNDFFETNEDVFLQLIKEKKHEECYIRNGEKFNIDLKLLNKQQLLNSGIINIDISDYCTCCMSGVFFSYRKEKGHTARHSAILKIRGDK